MNRAAGLKFVCQTPSAGIQIVLTFSGALLLTCCWHCVPNLKVLYAVFSCSVHDNVTAVYEVVSHCWVYYCGLWFSLHLGANGG